MNALLSLMETGHVPEKKDETRNDHQPRKNIESRTPPPPPNGAKGPTTPQWNDRDDRDSSSTKDEQWGIRLSRRKMDRYEIDNMISPLDFHSAPRLAAMSRQALSQMVGVAENGYNGGKTNLATVGIMFRNSGTKLSRKGSAFCILQVGDLKSGPVISLFLFGEAYSKHNTNGAIPEGSVVAILSPTILPAKNGGDTTLSLSVIDALQVVVVGSARDYGVCGAVHKTKRNGVLVEVKCRQHVDLRVGVRCDAHRSSFQRKRKRSAKTTSSVSGVSFIQKVRSDTINERPLMNNATTQAIVQGKQLRRAPLNMIKTKTTPTIPTRKRTKPHSSSTPLVSRNEIKKKRRHLASNDECDGEVYIPKPSPLFSRQATATPRGSTLAPTNDDDEEETTAKILEKQRLLSQAMKKNRRPRESSPAKPLSFEKKSRPPPAANTTTSTNDDNPLFDSLANLTTETLASAKSLFETEADAERYAKSRRKLTALEKKEWLNDEAAKKTKKNKNAAATTNESAIRSEWSCRTCGRRSAKRPMGCLVAKHVVRFDRIIERTVGAKEGAVTRNGRNGGLVVGSGLEWSGFRHSGE